MKDVLKKIAIVAGTIASITGALQDVPFVPAEYQPVIATIGTIAAALAGIYHPVPEK